MTTATSKAQQFAEKFAEVYDFITEYGKGWIAGFVQSGFDQGCELDTIAGDLIDAWRLEHGDEFPYYTVLTVLTQTVES